MLLRIERSDRYRCLVLRIGAPALKFCCAIVFTLSLAAPTIWGIASPARTDLGGNSNQTRANQWNRVTSNTALVNYGTTPEGNRRAYSLENSFDADLPLTPAVLHASHPASLYALAPLSKKRAEPFKSDRPTTILTLADEDAPAPATTPSEVYARRHAQLDTPISRTLAVQRSARRPLFLLASAAAAPEPPESDDSRLRRRRVSSYAASPQVPTGSTSSSVGSTREASPATEQGSPRDARRSRTRTGTQATARVSMHNVAVESAASGVSRGGAGRVRSDSLEEVGSGIPGALGSAADLSRLAPGLRIDNVQLFSGYSSNGVPSSGFFAPGASLLGADMDVGARATISYRRAGQHNNFTLAYSPGYTARFRYNQWNTADHILSLGFSRELGARWGFAVKADGGLVGLEQAWLVAPTIHRVENPPTSIEELMERAAAGEFTDDEVASLLTGSPVVDDPGGIGLGVSRVVRAAANATLTYAHSPRTSMSFSGSGSTYQVLTDDGPERVNFFQRSDLLTGNLGLKHKLDSRTTIGVDGTSRSIRSNFQRGLSNQISVSYSKVLRSRWEYSIRGGGGVANNEAIPGQGTISLPLLSQSATPTWVLGGSLRYSGRANRFGFSLNRDTGDSWGTGATAMINGGLDWQWMRPTSSWGLSAGASYSRSVGDQDFRNIESALAHGGLVQRLNAVMMLRTDYIYSRYASAYRGLVPNIAIHRVQATLVWSPRSRRR